MSSVRENRIEETLSSIERVEANPYLITRIKERIKQNEVASAPLMWTIGLSFMLILAVNIVGFKHVEDQEITRAPNSELNNLLPQNSLYD